MKNYTNYEDLEEQFRYMIVQSIKLPDAEITVPVLEDHPPAPELKKYRENRRALDREKVLCPPHPPKNTDYGVVQQITSEEFGEPETQERKISDDEIELNVCSTQQMTFSVEFCGIEARNLAQRSKLWMDSDRGTEKMMGAGFTLLNISGPRALHEYIKGGSAWERRAQFDVDILVSISQEPAYRQIVGIVKQPVFRTHAPQDLSSANDNIHAVSFKTEAVKIPD